ncbi:MAG: glycosyl hydrolase [Defluviitaleaceae bacterium]|nr:glycosyl hydrolase [Defluviitaleaceae bacterium]
MPAPSAPLFRDPIYDTPTDPAVIWNNKENCWWLVYTQRRNAKNTIGVTHIHGTSIGVASSKDGGSWLYRGTLLNLEFEPGHNTFWAPEVIYAQGKYHMYVSYVRGIPTNWGYQRFILHYTAHDLWSWRFESILDLSSDKVIDACVYKTNHNTYKMWYKDEANNSHTWSATSHDLYNWTVCGEEINDKPHEGANVFEHCGCKWLITDEWNGLGVYKSEDFANWERTGVILREGGSREWDNVMGQHADVLVCGENAYIFYFTHPFHKNENRRKPGFVMGEDEHRTCIQVAKLKADGGKLICDRDEPFELVLTQG